MFIVDSRTECFQKLTKCLLNLFNISIVQYYYRFMLKLFLYHVIINWIIITYFNCLQVSEPVGSVKNANCVRFAERRAMKQN